MKTAASKKFDKLMERSQEQTYRKLYKEALKTLGEAAAILQKEQDSSPESWAWIYDGRRYALFEDGQIDEALSECNAAITHLSKNGTWAYLSSHNHIRSTLRASHNMLAWTLAQRAKNEEDCKVALRHIVTCLETISPIEEKEVSVPFLDTHAVVLHKMMQLADDPDTYRSSYFIALAELVKRNPQALEENKELKQSAETSQFKAHLAEDPIIQLCSTPENESFDELVSRFSKALELAAKRNENYPAYYPLKFEEALTEAHIQELEKALGFSLPDDLRNLALERGPFSIGESSEISIMGGWQHDRQPTGLINYIDWVWGGRPEFEEFYKEQELAYINNNYFALGVRYQDDNTHDYIFFDRFGRFGTIMMNQDYFEAFQDDMEPMLKKSPASESLQQVLSRQFSAVIKEKILDQYFE